MRRLVTTYMKRRSVQPAGDFRLARIWKILNFYGFLSFSDEWRPTVKLCVYLTLLVVTYIKDGAYFIGRLIEGNFKVPEDVEILTFMQTQGITIYRIYLLIRYREGFRRLVAYITEEFPSWIAGDEKRKELFSKSVKRGTWIYFMHSGQLIVVATLLVCRPMWSQKPFTLLMQPPLGTLPWLPSDQNYFYHINYAFQVWANTMAISTAFCMNMLFFTLIVRACAHLDCLAEDAEDLCTSHNASKLIGTLVDRYNRVRQFTELLNKLFFLLTAVLPIYTGLSVITSLLVFDGTQQSFSFAGIAVAHMLELFIYCYAGDLVAEKSCEIGARLFASRWYELPPKERKSVLQVLHQCQRPFIIQAGIFENFSRQMFTTTMKTTYSMWCVANQAKQ